MNFNTYGFLIGVGVILVLISLDKYTIKKKQPLLISDYLLLTISTLIGARALYILHNISEIQNGTVTWWNISDGGLAIYGAFLGLILSTFLISKIRKIPLFVLTDGIVKNLPLAQSLGRFGNYFNQELYGKPTHLPWGIHIPLEKRLEGYIQYSTFHPTYIYESILNIFNWLILKKLLKQKKYKDGTITGIYLVNYGVIRVIMNMLRIDKEYLFGIETSDLASVLAISLGILILILISPKRVKKIIAKIFSDIFNAYLTLILPILYATLCSNINIVPKLVISGLITLTPISVYLVLKGLGKVSNFDITDRKERPPYCITVTLIIGVLYLASLELGNTILSTVVLNTLITSSVFTLITLFWKISGHMTYLTMAYCSFVYLIPSPFTILLFPIVPFVAWSRVELGRHNILQVILGTVIPVLISVLVFTLS
jgi:phosphatidylglycerol:prolipoprotein diacylglycerol transferase